MEVSEDFARLADPFRPELLAHCYRMLGSVHDAEDQVQETMIRAWRSYGDFEGRSSLRTWLYRIATNSCLRALENSARRPLPSGLGGPGEYPEAPLAAARPEVRWLQPIPDALVSTGSADPAEIVASRQGMRLALIAALQYLPARQRAVLILRDVLRWRAAEVAELLGTTTPAVNGMLQRARARLEQAAPGQDRIHEPDDPQDRALLDRFATAFQNADVTAVVQLLREDAVFEMPPEVSWFAGRELIGRFLRSRVLTEPGCFQMIPVAANGQPALAAYLRGHDGGYRAHSICVLTIAASRVTRVTSFNDPGLFATFGLPQTALAAAMASRCLSHRSVTRSAWPWPSRRSSCPARRHAGNGTCGCCYGTPANPWPRSVRASKPDTLGWTRPRRTGTWPLTRPGRSAIAPASCWTPGPAPATSARSSTSPAARWRPASWPL
jgi:RNA polymerase sigma-70 factor (ECF subfamily)